MGAVIPLGYKTIRKEFAFSIPPSQPFRPLNDPVLQGQFLLPGDENACLPVESFSELPANGNGGIGVVAQVGGGKCTGCEEPNRVTFIIIDNLLKKQYDLVNRLRKRLTKDLGINFIIRTVW